MEALSSPALAIQKDSLGFPHLERVSEEGDQRRVRLAIHRRSGKRDLQAPIVLAQDLGAGGPRLNQHQELNAPRHRLQPGGHGSPVRFFSRYATSLPPEPWKV